jgi:hypothetical protein
MRRLALLSLVLVIPATVRADKGELYALIGGQFLLPRYDSALGGPGRATPTAGGLDAVAYYGLTNWIHVGAAVHVSRVSDVTFENTRVTLSDGSPSTGAVYLNDLASGGGAVALCRFDTGYRLAPVLSLELGVNHHSYTEIDHVPAGASYQLAFPDVSEFVLSARGELLLEYRFTDHLVAAAGVSAVAEQGHMPWQLGVPLRFGVIW